MKKILFSAVLVLFLSVFSACTAKPVLLPGEKTALIQNVYSEYFNIAEEYYKLKNYSKAQEFYQIAQNSKSLKNLASYRLADCYVQSSKWADAISLYKVLLNEDLSNSSLKESLAYCYAMQNEYEVSVSLYRELLNENPNSESYIENTLIILLADENNLSENLNEIQLLIERLKEVNGENKNLSKFEEKISF